MSIDPATLAIASTVASAASTVIGAAGARQQADAQAAAMQYQAAVARNNQIIAQQNADFERQRGAQQEQAQRQKTAQLLGQQRARMAASGVDISGGSPLRLQGDTAELGELDALTIRNNAARAAYGYEVQGSNFDAEAGLRTMSAQNAEKAGDMGVMTSIIGGASSVADKWLRYQNAGVFSGGGGGAGSSGWLDAGTTPAWGLA